jgi:hypothetical protein
LYNAGIVTCPSCGSRKGRRLCPALGAQICTVCCGTKRLSQIRCPSDCSYLATAREHPSAATLKRERKEVTLLSDAIRDLSEAQVDLFVLLNTVIVRHRSSELQPLLDVDIVESAEALAATYETAARGVIYEHRTASLPAERLASELRTVAEDATRARGSKGERDAALVLRRSATAARQAGSQRTGPRAYLELLQRTLGAVPLEAAKDAASAPKGPIIQVP